MTALGGDLDLNVLLAQLSEERAKKYSDEALAVAKLRRYPTGNFRSLVRRLGGRSQVGGDVGRFG